jgi:hypothetical protein
MRHIPALNPEADIAQIRTVAPTESRLLEWRKLLRRYSRYRCRSEALKYSGLREPVYALRPFAIVSESLAVDFSLSAV